MNKIDVEFSLNGRSVTDRVAANLLVIDYLRDRHGMYGAKIGCSRGICGACMVLLDSKPIAACSLFAFQLDGCKLTTIEAGDGKPDAVQQAFIDNAAFQCGYCTPGMILLTRALLESNKNPDRATVVEWLSSNVCRCTGYAQIIAAVEDAAAQLRKTRA